MKLNKNKNKLTTFFLFPMLNSSRSKKLEVKKSRGISLLIAIMSIAVMVGFMADLILTSAVSVEYAMSTKNKIKSEYIAKSGLNLGLFLFNLSWAITLGEVKQKVKKSVEDTKSSYWTLINSLPPVGSRTLELAKSMDDDKDVFKVKGLMNEKSANIISLFEDQFTIKVEDEYGKINVNDCSKGMCLEVIQKLIALFSCPAEKKFLSDKGVTPEELAYRIKDFISDSSVTSPKSGYSDKNDPYTKGDLNYKVKKLPFDSIEELKLVDGWDDEVHAVFSPYLTVFPINNVSKREKSLININTAPKELLACLVPSSLDPSCYRNFSLKMKKRDKKGDAVRSIRSTVENLLCHKKNSEGAGDPATWFSKKSWVFKITSTGETGSQETVSQIIIRRNKPQDKKYKITKGIEKRSYEVLATSTL